MHRLHAGPAADVAARFGAFVVERFPLAAALAIDAFGASGGAAAHTEEEIERVRAALPQALLDRLNTPVVGVPVEATPGVSASARFAEGLLEPPGVSVWFEPSARQGFATGPKAEVSLDEPMANSSRFSLPSITAPSRHRLAVTVLS